MTVTVTGPAGEYVGFAPGAEVDVRQLDDKNWRTLTALPYRGKTQTFEVPAGFTTDFASVPRPFAWFLPRYGRYTKAAILHDYLWRQKVPEGALSLHDADGIFRQAMRILGVPFLRRWILWAAVRLGALTKPGGLKGWLIGSWQVIPVAVVALPVVAPAALMILLTMPVFYLAELLAWAALGSGRLVFRRSAPPTKQLNRPSLRLKT